MKNVLQRFNYILHSLSDIFLTDLPILYEFPLRCQFINQIVEDTSRNTQADDPFTPTENPKNPKFIQTQKKQ